MARDATRGHDGEKRFSVSIPARVGQKEIVAALIHFSSNGSFPATRTEAMRMTKDFLRRYGEAGVTGSRRTSRKVLSRFQELFPDLQNDDRD